MIKRILVAVSLAIVASATSALAQSTGLPSYNAPHRAFESFEVGGTVSFPKDAEVAFEGQFRWGHGLWDIGVRAGWFDPGGNVDGRMVAGIEGRTRVVTHSESFPLDGAVIVGAGGHFNNGSAFIFPAGVSLGRRIENVSGSSISFVPYIQPSIGFTVVNPEGDAGVSTDIGLMLGFGIDMRISRTVDLRFSAGISDEALATQGFAFTVVFVH